MVFLNTCLFIYIVFILLDSVIGMYSSKTMEGYPSGYLDNCPGSNKKAVISTKSLRKISFVVQGEGNVFTASRTTYNYYQMKQLANDSNIDFRNRKTFIFCGGYLDSPNFPIARIIGAEYKRHNYNVLAVDANFFVTFEYPVTARFMRPFGKRVAEMLAVLTKEGLNPKDIEIAGISLGGQTMSYIAKNYRLITGMNISRLTGLDPAGPCFRDLGPDDRLDQTDADFVDVIKTNIDGYGMAAPIGHVNFYVNGGEYQPGEIEFLPCTMLCSHARVYLIWLSALQNPNRFIGIQCDSVQEARRSQCYGKTPLITNVLGLNSDKSKQGIFYLSTSNSWPFYLGKNGMKREFNFFQHHLIEMNRNEIAKA